MVSNRIEVPEELKVLANKPYRMVSKYNTYAINGYKFQTQSYNRGKTTQNFGVAVVASTSSFSSAKDKNPVIGEVTYYGIIKEIIELNYSNKGSVVLFKCDWVDTIQGRGIQKDKYGITLVNFNHLLNTSDSLSNEPFILATQATQVYYVQDSIEEEWHAVVFSKPRDMFDMGAGNEDDHENINCYQEPIEPLSNDLLADLGDDICARSDINGVTIDGPLNEATKAKGYSLINGYVTAEL